MSIYKINGTLAAFLEDLRTREKVMRSLQYGVLLTTACSNSKKQALETVSADLGRARLILRLFDDSAMLRYAFTYGLGKKEPNIIKRLLHLLSNIVDVSFFPLEHIGWLQQTGILSSSSKTVMRICLKLWAASLVLSITRSFIQALHLRASLKKTVSLKQREDTLNHSIEELLLITMYMCDLLNALNWLGIRPWHQEFPSWMTGFLGLISSLLGLRKLIRSRQ